MTSQSIQLPAGDKYGPTTAASIVGIHDRYILARNKTGAASPRLLIKGFSLADISEITGLSVREIKSLGKSMG